MKERNLPLTIHLYDAMYEDNIPKNQLFVVMFDALPSTKIDTSKFYDISIIEFLEDHGFVKYQRNSLSYKNSHTINEILLINKKREMFIEGKILTKEKNLLKLYFSFNIAKGELDKQFNIMGQIEKKFRKEKKKFNINLMKKDMSGLDIEEFDLEIPDIDIELNYGKEFVKVNKKISEKLNVENGSGIVLLHGKPGTGKTTYLKYLTKIIKDKSIIFIPPSVAESLSDPSIIPFLMDHKNSILIIEDGEKVISNRENNGSSVAVSNLLNLTDGILGECLNIQIIVTFNMSREKIDEALLRKGRLIAEHKFELLSVKDSNILLEHIGKDLRTDKPLSLADIFFIDTEDFRVSNNGEKQMGFK